MLRDQSQRRRRIDPAVVERAPADNPGDAVRLMRFERRNIGKRGNSAGGDNRNSDLSRQIGHYRRVDTCERPIARNVGVNNSRHSAILEAPGHLDCADPRCLGPPLNRDASVARIDGDANRTRMIGGGMPHELGVAQGCGAEHDAPMPSASQSSIAASVADAAAELDAQIDRGADRPHHRARR